MTTLKQDLEATKAWLETHEWGQGFTSNRPERTYCVLESAMGALGDDIYGDVRGLLDNERYTAVANALDKASGNKGGAVSFNDQTGRTKDGVIALVEQAIKAAS